MHQVPLVLAGAACIGCWFLKRKFNSHSITLPPKTELSKRDFTLEDALISLRNRFDLGKETLESITNSFLLEMREGLKTNGKSSLAMIPTFVKKLPKGTEKGVAVAIDVGGSNLRILKITLGGSGQITQVPLKMEIPDSVQKGDGGQLFDFIADAVKEVVGDLERVPLGYTFSFPINQTSINSGILIKWTKGFTAEGVVNKDVVALLNESLAKKGVKHRVDALINDTVGTQLAGCYQSEDSYCFCGVIVGTGSNNCYMESISNIPKYNATPSEKNERMIINMESGNFGSREDRIGRDLPMTEFDFELDDNSSNKRAQLFEKQISGMYLGEITRLILKKFMNSGLIFKGQEKFNVPYKFTTEEMSKIEADDSNDLSDVSDTLTGHGIKSSLEERKFVKSVVHLVARRAAQLAAVAIAAIHKQFTFSFKEYCSSKTPLVAAVDGSVFEKYPQFSDMMRETLDNILGTNAVTLILAKDGSGNGAALASVAATSS